jgi:hypothetical protein
MEKMQNEGSMGESFNDVLSRILSERKRHRKGELVIS